MRRTVVGLYMTGGHVVLRDMRSCKRTRSERTASECTIRGRVMCDPLFRASKLQTVAVDCKFSSEPMKSKELQELQGIARNY
jgi:hypothetical protein